MSNRAKLLIWLFYPIFWITWLFYQAFMGIKRDKELYKEKLGHAWYGGYPFLFIGLAMDVLFNITFGSVYFREFPKEWLFTGRCARHLKGSGIQLLRAQNACTYLLDPADKGHCN